MSRLDKNVAFRQQMSRLGNSNHFPLLVSHGLLLSEPQRKKCLHLLPFVDNENIIASNRQPASDHLVLVRQFPCSSATAIQAALRRAGQSRRATAFELTVQSSTRCERERPA